MRDASCVMRLGIALSARYSSGPMIVMKFGGSSVSNGERIRRVIEIVRARLPRKPIVVASAFRGVTDDLFAAADDALKGREALPDKVPERHESAISEHGLSPGLVQETL